MKHLLLFFVLLSLPCFGKEAKEGQETGNGGDPVAIEFMTRAFEAAVNIRSTPTGYSDLQNIDILGVLEKTEIFVVDKPLKVRKDGIEQVSTAMNVRNPNRIYINRASWNSIGTDRLKQALALHEVLSLAGMEQTGVYKLVSQYELIANKPISLPKYGLVWSFREPTATELKDLKPYIPEIPGRKKPDTIAAISQTLRFLARINDVYREVLVQILEYNLSEEGFFFQVLVTDSEHHVLAKRLVLDSPDFRVTTDMHQQLEVLQVSASDKNEVGYQVHPLGGKPSYFLGFGMQRTVLKDIAALPNDNEVLMLGKTENGPYGLYRGWVSSPAKLVKAFKQTIPGNGASAPIHMVHSILGVFKNDRGLYAVVNDLEGIVVVNIDTGESKAIYEVPEENRFAAVVGNEHVLAGDTCIDLNLGIYSNDQGGIFYEQGGHTTGDRISLPGQPGEEPLYLLHLGVEVTSEFFRVSSTGCR